MALTRARFVGPLALSMLTGTALIGGIPWRSATAQEAPAGEEGPVVLIVAAHPDDEAMFAGSIYKITHSLGGVVDLALVTDGSGGYRYAYLAEPIYGLELTDEQVAREYLPTIRKRELMEAGAILGIRNYFFLDAYDNAYTENVDSVLSQVWDAKALRSDLAKIMRRGSYDFVFAHLTVPAFHAHHVAATILALEAAGSLPGERPVVLGSFIADSEDPSRFDYADYSGLEGYPVTRVRDDVEPFVFDRKQPLREDGRLDYRILVNWVIAEHKTQGTMQLLMNTGDTERFWYFEINDPGKLARTRELFERLAEAGQDPIQ